MAVLTVRNVPDEVHRALRARAAAHGHSAAAEVREILEEALLGGSRQRLGDALVLLGRELELTDDDLAVIESVREQSPAHPLALP